VTSGNRRLSAPVAYSEVARPRGFEPLTFAFGDKGQPIANTARLSKFELLRSGPIALCAALGCLSVVGAPSESRRCAAPRIAGTRFRAPIFEQLHHVLAIELSRMRLLEVISDVGELEANPVPLR
jgi:hypothetical protein